LSRSTTRIMGPDQLEAVIEDLADRIRTNRLPNAPLGLVGIRTRGVPIAERIAQRLGDSIPVGAVDITLYRDDLHGRGHWPVLKGTEIPFNIQDAEIVLVDDVLFTGRTVRAALNAICDLGRPARVRLAVLVDRQGRELPIRADYVGSLAAVEPRDRVEVHLRPVDPVDEVLSVPGS